jgi:hypothetical protein
MRRKITIAAYGDFSLQDYTGLEAYNHGRQWTSVGGTTDDTIEFVVGEGTWNRIREQLVELSQRRVPIVGTSHTQPLLTYTVELLPGLRPRLHQVEGSLSLAGATQTVVLRGSNMICGTQAVTSINTGTSELTFTATRKGPSGNLPVINLAAATGAGSVTVKPLADGNVTIDVVPPAAAPGANAIAAQIAANSTAALYTVATGGGTGTVGPCTNIRMADGDGAGVAFLVVPRTTNYLHSLLVEAVKPGNQGNLISLTLSAASGAGSVTVSGNDITVVPAAAGPDGDDVATQIAANAAAAALIKCTGVATAVPVITKTYLAGGSGETPSVTIGGAAATITVHTDAAITCTVTGAALTAAGGVAAEQAVIDVVTNYSILSAQLAVGA